MDSTKRRRETAVQAGGLEVDIQTREVRKDGKPVQLTPLEFRILHLLAANQGRVVPYERLIDYAWGPGEASPTHLKIRVCALRKKLDLPINGAASIRAVTSTGYSLQGCSG